MIDASQIVASGAALPPAAKVDGALAEPAALQRARGEGRLHIGEEVEALAPGAAFRLRPREVHIVENTQPEAELAVLGIFTPAGSPSAAYLEPHVAGAYTFAG